VTEARLQVIIVEDEPIARASLVALVREVGWLDVVADLADGESGLRAIIEHRPHLVLLDIMMPGLTGIAIAERIPFAVGVIFTTAYDDHAVKAFELGALDYLQKPFGRDRLLKALERARPAIERIATERTLGHSAAHGSEPSVQTRIDELSGDGPLLRLFVRDRGRVIPIRVEDLVRCEAEDDYVALHAGGRRHLLYVRLSALEGRLAPEQFIRIHRSHLVNVACIAAIEPYDASRLAVRLRDGTTITASRTGTALLREFIRG
jgi:two-component system, LytTR family, response regulator